MTCSGSISLFFSSTESLRFFFQPLQLHLELSNLLIKLRQKLFPVLILLPPMVRKETGKLFKKLLSPLADLIPVNTKFTGKLSNGLFPFHGFQGNLSLESCIVSSSHAVHRAIPPFGYGRLTCTLYPCPVFGEHYS